MQTATDIVAADLDRMREDLREEMATMAGHRLLITGGAGFLGYYLVGLAAAWNRDARAEDRIQLRIWDNFIRGTPVWLEEAASAPGCAVERVDLTAPLPDGVGPLDFVIHAAGIASPTVYRQYPLETMDANITGLRNLLEHVRAQEEPPQGFLFFSSSEIYGDPPADMIPTPESYRGNVSCTGPRACYDESKRYGETLCTVFARQYGVPASMARPFNNYGPGLRIDDRRVLPDYASCVLAGRDIVMHSDGRPTRTFCYATDAITGYFKVLVRGRRGEPYNIGVETPEISMVDLAHLVRRLGADLFGYTGQVITRPSTEVDYLVDNPQRRCPDIRKARTDLAYAPGVDLEEGVRRSLIWYSGQDGSVA